MRSNSNAPNATPSRSCSLERRCLITSAREHAFEMGWEGLVRSQYQKQVCTVVNRTSRL